MIKNGHNHSDPEKIDWTVRSGCRLRRGLEEVTMTVKDTSFNDTGKVIQISNSYLGPPVLLLVIPR